KILAAALTIARELQRRDEHGGEYLLAGQRLGRRRVLEAGQERDALLVHRIEAARENRLEQVLLAAEVIVDRGEVDARRRRDLAQRRRLKAVLHEQLFGGVENPALGRRIFR